MEAFVVIALIGLGLLLAELLLPTGGVLAAIGIAGLTGAGIVALGSDSSAADYIGGALIALGVICAISFYFITRKVLAAHRETRVRTGTEEIVGSSAEARSSIDPEGQVWLGGTIWSARLAAGAGPVRLGDRVTVEAVDGLTLVVRPEPQTAVQSKEGAR
ncbi:MAG TPA: NfeD family protein [Solirubrobacterales bacterium]|nr:NfeD family protein [Solirubrobacterales bacterium]